MQLRRRQLLGPAVDQRLQSLTRLVGRLAGGRALLGRQLSHRPQEVGQLGLAPQILDPEFLQLGGGFCGGDSAFGLRPQLRDALPRAHERAILVVSSYRAKVAAMATLRESFCVGMWVTRSACSSRSGGR